MHPIPKVAPRLQTEPIEIDDALVVGVVATVEKPPLPTRKPPRVEVNVERDSGSWLDLLDL